MQREDPSRIEEQLHRLIERAHEKPIDPRRLRWSYTQNPEGPAVIWTLRDRTSGSLAGYTAALPRTLRVDGRERRAWVGADFSILREYRTLGLALRLRRAAREELDAGAADLLYSLPNQRMRLIHQKVGHVRLGRLVRLARPVSAAKYLRRSLRSRALVRALTPCADLVLAIRGRPFRRAASRTRVELAPRFDERFDRLFELAAPQHPIVGVRSGRTLTWRWSLRPGTRTHAVLAEQGRELAGYLLFQVQGGVAVVVDLLALPHSSVQEDLIVRTLAEARRLRLAAVSLAALEGSSLLPLLRRQGFVERPEAQEVFLHPGGKLRSSSSLVHPSRWYLLSGDGDV